MEQENKKKATQILLKNLNKENNKKNIIKKENFIVNNKNKYYPTGTMSITIEDKS